MRDQHYVSYEFGSFRLDPTERRLTREGKSLELAPKAFALLHTLVKNAGHLVEKDVLLRELWPDSFVEEGNLTVYVAALRKTLGERDTGQRFIETVPKGGYRFTASVKEAVEERVPVLLAQRTRIHAVTEEEEIEISDDAGLVVPDTPASPIAVEQTTKNNATRRRLTLSRQRAMLVGAVTLLALGLTAVFVLRDRFGSRSAALPFALENFTWHKLSADNNSAGALISPDGEFIVYIQDEQDGSWSLRMRRLSSKESVVVLPIEHRPFWGMTLTHDGSFVYYTLGDDNPDTGSLYKVSVLGGPPQKIAEQVNSPPTLSPEDERVAFIRSVAGHDALQLVTAEANDGSGERVVETSDSGPKLIHPAWSPDGQRIVCYVRQQRSDGNFWWLVEIPVDGGLIKQITVPRKQQMWWYTWFHDGSGFIMDATDPISGKVQVYYISYPGGEIKRITNDLSQYRGISVNERGDALVTTQMERESNIYITGAKGEKPVKITTTACCPDTVKWTNDYRLVFDAIDNGKRQLWIMNRDGTGQQNLSLGKGDDWQPSASPDGHYLVFLSNRSGARELWRADIDGRNARQLTYGSDSLWLPGVSADSRAVYFTEFKEGIRVLMKEPIGGGEATQVTSVQTDLWAISPDGRLLAYSFFDSALSRQRLAVQPLEGGSAVFFDIFANDILSWTPDSSGLIYKENKPQQGADSVLWLQPIAGARPRQLLNWAGEINYCADWSRGGDHLALIRGHTVSNVVMLKGSTR